MLMLIGITDSSRLWFTAAMHVVLEEVGHWTSALTFFGTGHCCRIDSVRCDNRSLFTAWDRPIRLNLQVTGEAQCTGVRSSVDCLRRLRDSKDGRQTYTHLTVRIRTDTLWRGLWYTWVRPWKETSWRDKWNHECSFGNKCDHILDALRSVLPQKSVALWYASCAVLSSSMLVVGWVKLGHGLSLRSAEAWRRDSSLCLFFLLGANDVSCTVVHEILKARPRYRWQGPH